MEAARVLTLRGHHVTLYEKSNELDGVFIAAAAPDFKEKDKMLIQWYIKQMKDLKINIQMNKEITEETLKNLSSLLEQLHAGYRSLAMWIQWKLLNI